MSSRWINRTAIASIFGSVLLASWQGWGLERVEGRILDDASGEPVAATLFISDSDGKPLEPEGKHSHVGYLGKRRCYIDGAFALRARPGHLKIDVRRGLETIPLQTDLEVTAGTSKPLTLRL